MPELVLSLILLGLLISIPFAIWRFVWACEKMAKHLEIIADSLALKNV